MQTIVICQQRLNVEVKFLLNANRKLYMPRPLAQQRMTLSDLESTSSASRAISAVAELVFTRTDIVMHLWSSCSTFRRRLKTFLFQQSYRDLVI